MLIKFLTRNLSVWAGLIFFAQSLIALPPHYRPYEAPDLERMEIERERLRKQLEEQKAAAYRETSSFQLQGKVVDAGDMRPLAADVYVYFRDTSDLLESTKTGEKDGKFSVAIPKRKMYTIVIKREKYLSHSFDIAFSDTLVADKIFRETFLKKISPGELIFAHAVTFPSGSSVLKGKSKVVAEEIIAFLKQNDTVVIELEGHASRASGDGDADNEKGESTADAMMISEKRAEQVRQYLIKNGIAGNRLKVKGYGNANPIAENITQEGREKNQRVEFRILQ